MIKARIEDWMRRRRSRREAARAAHAAPLPLDDPRLEVYLHQIADLPPHDRTIIVGVLQNILAEEAAYERRVLTE